MFARVTSFEVDALRVNVQTALQDFQASVVPELEKQPGYDGLWVLLNPDGRGMLLSLWETEDQANASVESGFYEQQVAKFVTVLRQAPGRDHYRVVLTKGAAVGVGQG